MNTCRGKKRYGKGWAYGVPMVLDMNGYKVTAIVCGAAKSTDGFVLDYDEVIPETVCRFSGLHDKNGKEVYEGDLYTAFGSQKYEIRFVNGSFCGGIFDGDDSMFDPLGWASPDDDEDLYIDDEIFKIMEVIGNIHDNPAKDEIQP